MLRGINKKNILQSLGFSAILIASPSLAQQGAIVSWQDDLSQIASTDWNYDRAAHLLERAGFGGTPEDIQASSGDVS